MPFCRLSTVASFITRASSTTMTPTQLLTTAEPMPGPRPMICRQECWWYRQNGRPQAGMAQWANQSSVAPNRSALITAQCQVLACCQALIRASLSLSHTLSLIHSFTLPLSHTHLHEVDIGVSVLVNQPCSQGQPPAKAGQEDDKHHHDEAQACTPVQRAPVCTRPHALPEALVQQAGGNQAGGQGEEADPSCKVCAQVFWQGVGDGVPAEVGAAGQDATVGAFPDYCLGAGVGVEGVSRWNQRHATIDKHFPVSCSMCLPQAPTYQPSSPGHRHTCIKQPHRHTHIPVRHCHIDGQHQRQHQTGNALNLVGCN